MASDAFQKFKSTINRGVTTISVKTSSSLEKVKIKTHIESINKEIDHLMQEIGKKAYGIWENNSGDFSVLEELFSIIKQKKEEITQLVGEYESIDDRDGQILGTSITETTKVADEIVTTEDETITCPQCGMVYIQSVRFCKKCGQQLKS